jgi:hypothetical protein
MRVCDECVRATALIGPREGFGLDTSWNVISRHPEAGADCALCGRGQGVHAADQFVALVIERRVRRLTAEAFEQARREWRATEDDH